MKKALLFHSSSRQPAINASCIFLFAILFGSGCQNPECIKVDLSGEEPRFLIHKRGWGWPFLWPSVDALSIASEQDGEVWRLKSTDPGGVPARRLAFVYGETPDGFFQELPENDAHPKPLAPGRNYFIGVVGKSLECGIAFALPVSSYGIPTTMPANMSNQAKSAESRATSAPSTRD